MRPNTLRHPVETMHVSNAQYIGENRTTWAIGRSACTLADAFRVHVKLSAIRAEAVVSTLP